MAGRVILARPFFEAFTSALPSPSWRASASPHEPLVAESCRVLIIARFVVHLHGARIHADSQFTHYTHRKEAHSLLLIGVKALIKRRPRVSELFGLLAR